MVYPYDGILYNLKKYLMVWKNDYNTVLRKKQEVLPPPSNTLVWKYLKDIMLNETSQTYKRIITV